MKVWGGIDPGNDGALALIFEDGRTYMFDAPTAAVKNGKRTQTALLPAEMSRLVILHTGLENDIRIYVEKVQAMPEQGRTSIFNFGMGYGYWLGILSAFQIPYELIHPRTWKAKMMADMGKEKAASVVKAMQLFPQLTDQLRRPKHGKPGEWVYLDGRADALLLAEMNRRQG